MKLFMYSVCDIKAGLYNRPFYAHNDGVAMRNFQDLANNRDTDVFRHPEDFALYLIGCFDDEAGTVEAVQLKSLGTAVAMQQMKS